MAEFVHIWPKRWVKTT